MAESRRVEFQTITTPKEEKKSKHRTLIPRFNLALGESTSRTCPEFSFTELVKKEKVNIGPDVTDPFGNEDDCHDEVAALAKKFEEKYGPKPGKKKRKLKCLEDDYFDMGDGYDESDPFIDNTEAYDEVVPSCMTTIHGGFYINRGTLDFRPVSDHEDSEAEFITPVVKKRGRPRKIADSEDSQEGGGGEEVKKKKLKKKKEKEGLGGEKKKKRKLTIGPDGDRIVKRKKLIDPEKKKKTSPTVKELLKHQTASTATLSTVNGSTDDHPAPTPPRHSPTVDKPDVADRTEGAAVATPVEGEEKKTGESEIQLSLDLPPELETAIVDIKKAAKDSKEGKCKFFSPHVNKLLLDIELASRQLPPGKRPLIYAHLADHLPCGKETLIKRAKKLRENQQDDQLKAPIQRLKEEIDKVMPALQEQHDKEVAKARLENKEKREGGEGQKEEGGVNTESDDDEKNATTGVTPETQSRKGNRDPRKKFKWTPQIRSFLCDIVRIKMHMFDTYKFRNQTAEEYLKTFLDNEVKVLWPQGWIQTRMLFKETRSVHGNWTNPAKPKRQVLGGRSAASPTPTSSLLTNTSVAESATSPSAPPAPPAGSGDPEVIEVSDIDEPLPAAAKDRVRATAVGPDEVPRTQGGSNLKFSPNTMEAVAAATAAAVAAALSPKSETLPSLGERRPHLMSEMLKRPGNTDSSPAIPRPPASVPKTPPTSDSGVSPFMAEFNRYLSNSNSMPPTSSSSRQGPSTSPPIPPSGQLQSRMVSSSTGRTEDGKAGHTLPTRWKVEEGVGTDRPRKPTPDVPPSVRPPNAHSGHKGPTAELSTYAHYKLMTSVLAGSEVNPDFPASPPMKTKGAAVRDQILAKIQAEMDAANARGAASGPSAAAVPGSQQRQAPPPAHTSRHSPPHPVFPSPPSELGNGGGGISRQLPPTRPSSKPPGISNASVLRQPSPVMPPYTPKHSAVNAAAASRPPHPVSRPSPSVSRSSPVARQSTKVVTRPSPSQGTQPAVSVGRQSPKTVSRALPGNLTRSAVVAGEKTSPGAGVGATRSITGAAPSQPLMSSFHSQHSSPTPLPPQRPPTSFANSASLPSVCVRPLSLPAQKKPSHAPPPPPSASTGNPPQSAQRVSTSLALNRVTQGQGQNVNVTAGQGQLNSQARVTAGQGALQKSLPVASVPVQRHLAPSQTPQGGHRGAPLPQGAQNLPRGAPGGVTSRGQGVGPSPGPPKVRPAAAAVDTHNRPGSAQRSQGDKAATSLSPANQGSKSASSTPHSRPAPQAPGIPTNSLRLQQPAAAVKGVASKASVTHSGTSATLPQPASLTPQTVVSSGLFNHRPTFRPLHSLSAPRPKDPPKPPPGLSQ